MRPDDHPFPSTLSESTFLFSLFSFGRVWMFTRNLFHYCISTLQGRSLQKTVNSPSVLFFSCLVHVSIKESCNSTEPVPLIEESLLLDLPLQKSRISVFGRYRSQVLGTRYLLEVLPPQKSLVRHLHTLSDSFCRYWGCYKNLQMSWSFSISCWPSLLFMKVRPFTTRVLKDSG